jgi:hypothetical protein
MVVFYQCPLHFAIGTEALITVALPLISPRWGLSHHKMPYTQGVALGFDIAHRWCSRANAAGPWPMGENVLLGLQRERWPAK